MQCPKCDGRIDKVAKKCKSCGFNMKELNGATHGDVKRARKEGFGADVLYVSELPPDISKKKLTLFCIFLGLVGGHCYYAGKIIRAIFSTVSFVCALGFGIFQVFWNELYYSSSMVIVWATSISYLLMGFNIVLNLMDLINIRINKYKVSVYKDEFSE